MAIKPPGVPGVGGIQPPVSTERIGADRVAGGFGQQVQGAAPVQAGASGLPVEGAITDVASEIRAGRLDRTQAVEAVIERIVVAQLPDGAASSPRGKERIALAQLALGDNPGFVSRVDRLLARELGETA